MIDRELLSAYADGEVTATERAQIELALKTDSAAVEHLSSMRATKQFVAEHARPVENDELWSTCVKRLGELDRTKKVEGFVGKYAWGLCALFFCVIVTGGMLRKLNPNSVRTGQVASYVSGLAGGWSRPPAAPQGQREWVEQKLGRMGADMQPDHFDVVACQEGLVDNHRVVRLLMRDSVGVVEMVVVSNVDTIDGGEAMGNFHAGTLNGANCVAWSQDGSAAFLMGDANQRTHQDLARIATAICPR